MTAFFSIIILCLIQQIALTVYDCSSCPAGQSFDKSRDFICQTSFSQGRDVNTCCVVDYLPISLSLWSCSLCRPGNIQGELTLLSGSKVLWCLPCTVSYCEDCDDDKNSCRICKSGYFLKVGAPPTCEVCSPICATCESLRKCTSCRPRVL